MPFSTVMLVTAGDPDRSVSPSDFMSIFPFVDVLVFEMQLHLLPMNCLLYLFQSSMSRKETSENPEYPLAEPWKLANVAILR